MQNIKIKQGIILIPDFSGFTEFVFNTKLFTGEYIVKQLLSELIHTNNGYFEISEIEGDAILFYKYKIYPSYKKIVHMSMEMLEAFRNKIMELNEILGMEIELSLKFIVHYGEFSQYSIGSFRKLYGKPVVEAHKLLKNEYTDSLSYILFSHSFLEAAENIIDYNISNHHVYASQVGMFLMLEKEKSKIIKQI